MDWYPLTQISSDFFNSLQNEIEQLTGTILSTLEDQNISPALAFYAFSLLFFSACCCLFVVKPRSTERLPLIVHTPYVQALSTIFVPAGASWSSRYDAYAHRLHRTVDLPLSLLIQDIVSGKLELRNYRDLADLFCGDLKVYGWIVRLQIDPPVLIKVSKRLLSYHFQSFSGSQRKGTLCELPPLSRNVDVCLSLDLLPHTKLETLLDAFISRLSPNALAALEFTTLSGGNVSFPSADFVYCAVPLLSQRQRRDIGPLYNTLPRILDFISRKQVVTIESVHNVSREYADALVEMDDTLVEDHEKRTEFLDQCGGLSAWRERRLMLSWEAALLTARLMKRWIIVFRKE